MADISADVKVLGVTKKNEVWRFEGQDGAGAKQEYVMSKSGDGTPPELGEFVTVDYGIQTKEYQGRTERTYWVNGWHPAAPFPDPEAVRAELQNGPQETADPKKAVNSYDEAEDTRRASIESQVKWKIDSANKIACLKASVEFWKARPSNITMNEPDTTIVNTARAYYHELFVSTSYVHISQETREEVEATPEGQIQRSTYDGDGGAVDDPRQWCGGCGQEAHDGACPDIPSPATQ